MCGYYGQEFGCLSVIKKKKEWKTQVSFIMEVQVKLLINNKIFVENLP